MSALAGVRVLDLTTIVAGPTASLILADLGADVIKVEPLVKGEDGRRMGPHRGPWGAYFVALHRGKRSMAVDLGAAEGRAAVLRLAATCDVFLESLRGDKAADLGLDEASVRRHRPDVVYASLSAYGRRGPDRNKPGYDAVLQGRTGIMSVTGHAEHGPARTGVSILDVPAGMWMALAVVAALFERRGSGQGQRVDTSLFQTGVLFMAYHLLYRQFTGRALPRQGTRHTAFAPYGVFEAQDRSIMIGISGDAMFGRLCSALSHPQWAADPRFETNPSRVANRDALDALINLVLATAPAAHWNALLNRHDVANDPVQSVDELLADPQLAALGQLGEIPLAGEDPALAPRLPIEFSHAPPRPLASPPAPGQHTRAILAEAGYSVREIDTLIQTGVCSA